MVRFFFYLLVLMLVFLMGIVVGLDRDHEGHIFFKPRDQEEIHPVPDEGFGETELALLPFEENDRLLTKLAFYSEKLVLRFYEVIVEGLYFISKLFI